jgi:hypothetical protein
MHGERVKLAFKDFDWHSLGKTRKVLK